jgi:hypothetical protein
MAQIVVKPNTSLFYSGDMAPHERVWRAKRNWQYQTLWGRWKDSSWPDPWMNNVEAYSEFYRGLSCAFAQLSAGDVYVMLPNDSNDAQKPESHWHNHEWPYLRKEPGKNKTKVKRVLRLSPDDFSKAEVIYERKEEQAAAVPRERGLLG